MEKGKLYVFYNNIYHFGRDENKVYVGKFVDFMKDEPNVMVFELPEGGMRFSTNVHDELQSYDVMEFIEYTSEKFQNRFRKNVSVIENGLEFIISIPMHRGIDYIELSDVEETMDNILEDWWSVQWHELEYNNIKCKRNSIEISFRVHDIHEVQFRYNKEVK